ncbi:PARP-type domain-containing protein (Fragment), partial [Durusdinium trenchii]
VLAVDQAGIKAADTPGSHLCQVVDALLADNNPVQPDQVLSESDFQVLVSNLLDEDKNYALQNSTRRQMVQRELIKPSFHQASIIIDILVQRVEPGINFFLRRTRVLYDLQYLSNANEEFQTLKDESKARFLKVIRGELGKELLSRYMSFLLHGLSDSIAMGLEGTQDQIDLIYQMVITCVSDLHRRFIEEFLTPPFTLLALADADEETFVKGWQELVHKYAECQCCVDYEFSTALLETYPCFSIPLSAEQQKDVQAVQNLLSECCIWSPLSSDAVEILNGQTQWALSRRGSQFVKKEKSAVETSLLGRAVKHYYWLAEKACWETLPQKRDGKHPDRTREDLETDADKAARFNVAANRRIRKLSGWNIFLKQHLSGGSHDTSQYTSRVKEASKIWKEMSQDDREAFEIEANHQDKLREELAKVPLSSAGARMEPTNLEQQVGAKSCKLLSARRLKLNDDQYDKHPLWDLPTCLADSKGALQVQNIDMDLTDKDIDIKLGETLHHPCETTQTNGEDLPNIHDSPCHHFICKKNCHYPRMEQLVRDLCWRLEEHEVKPGSLLLFTVADSSYPVILGVSMKRPITHIFLNASLDAEQVSFTDSTGALPQFQSSHQLMLTLLRKHSPDPDDILVVSVDAWHCRGFLETSGDATILKSNPDTLLCEFKITSERKAKKKPAIVILPLGFENRLKSMRAQARKKGGQASRKVQKKTKVKNTNPKQKATSSSGSSSDSEGNASGSNQTCGDREEEEAAPMSTVVAREEQAVEEVADEVVSVDLQRHEKAEVIKANTSTARSFFAKELGLDSAGTATTGRSICYAEQKSISTLSDTVGISQK